MHCLAKQVGQYYRRIRSQLIGSHHSSSPKLDECSSTDFSFASHLAALWPDLIYVPCCGYNSAFPQLRKFSSQFLKTTYSKNPVQKKSPRTFEMMERVTNSGQIILQYLCWDHSQQSYCTNKLFGAVWWVPCPFSLKWFLKVTCLDIPLLKFNFCSTKKTLKKSHLLNRKWGFKCV